MLPQFHSNFTQIMAFISQFPTIPLVRPIQHFPRPSSICNPPQRPSAANRRTIISSLTTTPPPQQQPSDNSDESSQPADKSNPDDEADAPDTSAKETETEPTPDPFETAQQAVQSTINNIFDTFFNPIRAACPLLSSSWTPTYGNYILHPPSTATSIKPKSVIHFLGGAFFGAVPHHLYHSFLARLCARGHVIVATPYNLSFEYLPIADGIARAWEAVEGDLAFRYGPLPVIGVGHSAGAVFHALTASLFDEAAPKAGNVFISFNCRSADDAIPSYGDIVTPIAKAAISGEKALPDDLRQRLQDFPQRLDSFVTENNFTPNALREEVLPVAQQSRRFIEQISSLLREISGDDISKDENRQDEDGENRKDSKDAFREQEPKAKNKSGPKEFYPSPTEVCAAIERLYPVSETLVVTFEKDSLDDSPQLIEVLQRCNGANHSVVELSGSHLTPLAQDAPDIAAAAAVISGGSFGQGVVGAVSGVIGEVVGSFGVGDLGKLEVVIDEWIEAGISSGKF